MNIQQVIKHYGSEVNAASALGRSTQTIINWRNLGKPLSSWNQHAIHSLSKGKLKVDAK